MFKGHEQTKRYSWEHFLLRAASEISLSEAQYQKIEGRYSQLQEILNVSDNSLLSEAHIFVQGSMRLKTTIKPVSGAPEGLDTIDADAIIWLPHAQGAGAQEILDAVEKRFKVGSRVQAEIKPLRRGIRIIYADENPRFHIDVTPARAIDGNSRGNGEGKLEVPDRVTGWKASSPIPYSDWLQVASKQTIDTEKRQLSHEAATQDPLPPYHQYIDQDLLRASIKLLKRHRDEWAIRKKSVDHRPISAIITTLATHAYLDVAKNSQSTPIRPLNVILEIVRKMPSYIESLRKDFFVYNPADRGENFAEKWNRPMDGHLYRGAFEEWHESANTSFSIGLESLSVESFAEAINESFGMGSAFIAEVNNAIPPHWTMPGRPDGTTRNSMLMGTMFGGVSGTASSQVGVKPVGRLG